MKQRPGSALFLVLSSVQIGLVWFGTTVMYFMPCVYGKTMVCNFENHSSSSLCDGWELEDAINVLFAVTDDSLSAGIPGSSPTADNFLTVRHSGVDQDGALFLTFSTTKPFAANLKLTFDYFLMNTTRSSSTKIQILDYESNVLIAFITEPTAGQWQQYSSTEVTVASPTPKIEFGIIITVAGGDIIAIDNFELTDAEQIEQSSSGEMSTSITEKTTEPTIIQGPEPTTEDSIDLLTGKVYAFTSKDGTELLTKGTSINIEGSTNQIDEKLTSSWTVDSTTTLSENPTESLVTVNEATLHLTDITREATSVPFTKTPSDSVTISSTKHQLSPNSVTVNLRNCRCQCSDATFA